MKMHFELKSGLTNKQILRFLPILKPLRATLRTPLIRTASLCTLNGYLARPCSFNLRKFQPKDPVLQFGIYFSLVNNL